MQKIPKIRSPKHRKFVASQPCMITNLEGENCNGTPVDAHHLMKMGGRGTSLKESDEWTVPLCRKHHIEVTGYGDEEVFWMYYNISYELVKDMAEFLSMQSPCDKIRRSK